MSGIWEGAQVERVIDAFSRQGLDPYFTVEYAEGGWALVRGTKPLEANEGLKKGLTSKNFLFTDFLTYLETEPKIVWRNFFKELWAPCQELRCSTCNQSFTGHELFLCRYHEREPEFIDDSNFGVIPCCGQRRGRFDP